eukprot:84999-Prymnesium_polylepis.1
MSAAGSQPQQQQVHAVHGSRGGGALLLKPCRLSFDPPLLVANALLSPCRIELRNGEPRSELPAARAGAPSTATRVAPAASRSICLARSGRTGRDKWREVLPRGGQLAWHLADLALPLALR